MVMKWGLSDFQGVCEMGRHKDSPETEGKNRPTGTLLHSEPDENRKTASMPFPFGLNYQRLFNSISDALVVVDMSGRLISPNPAFQALLGRPAEELVQMTYEDLTPAKWHAFERNITQTQLLPLGHSVVYEKEYLRKDGTVFPVELRTFLIRDDAGHPAFMGAIVRDITERKLTDEKLRESEQRFRTVIEQSIDVAYRRNLKTDCYDYLSPAIEGITGFTVEEFSQMSFTTLLENIHPDDHPVIQRRLEQFEKSRHGTHIQDLFEFRLKRKGGGYRWVSDSGALVTDADGTPLYHVGFVRDITERKQTEEALRQNNVMLEKAVTERTARLRRLATELTLAEQRERRRLSDFLHDDLQQVLVAAKFKAEKLTMDQAPDLLKSEALKLYALIAEAINKTRSTSNEIGTPLLYVVGFVPALRQLAEQMRERHSLRVTLDIRGVQESLLEDIKVHLFHSVRELLFNVAKHANTDTASVRISKKESQIEISVIDAGKGFDLKKAQPEDNTDCGYGLFSISERLGMIGGQMTIDSTPGSGTRVTLSVPDIPEPDPTPQTQPRPTGKVDSTSGPKGRARVLVADDHALVRNGVIQLLSMESSLEVVGSAANGMEALSLARQLRPDVIVMDVRMPEMDGIEATRLIMSEFPDTVIVGISAFGETGFKAEMLKAGAADLLDKADAIDTLVPTIERCMAERPSHKTRDFG